KQAVARSVSNSRRVRRIGMVAVLRAGVPIPRNGNRPRMYAVISAARAGSASGSRACRIRVKESGIRGLLGEEGGLGVALEEGGDRTVLEDLVDGAGQQRCDRQDGQVGPALGGLREGVGG